jgi:hypothetical protein
MIPQLSVKSQTAKSILGPKPVKAETRPRETSQNAAISTQIENKPISDRKLEANRRNAQRSTGPKTERGKNTSRYNPLKHGFFLKNMPIDAGPASEDSGDAKKLVRELFEYYQPVGPFEQFHFETIAMCCWKLRRLDKAETAHIKLQVQSEYDRRFRSFDIERVKCTSLLRDAERKAQSLGFIEDALINSVLENCSSTKIEKNSLILANQRAQQLTLQQGKNPTSAGNKAMKKAQLSLRTSLETFSQIHHYVIKEADKAQLEQRQIYYDQHRLPSPAFLDNLLRYQDALDRRLYRAVAELERLQRQRLGASVGQPRTLTM